MPRDTYNDGEILTDDLGRLWMVLAPHNKGLLMPELPEFLATVEGEDAKLPGFEFIRNTAAELERERCAKVAASSNCGNGDSWDACADHIAHVIRTSK